MIAVKLLTRDSFRRCTQARVLKVGTEQVRNWAYTPGRLKYVRIPTVSAYYSTMCC